MYYLLEEDTFRKPMMYRTRFQPPEFRLKASKWISGKQMNLGATTLEFELWEYEDGGDGQSEIFLDTVPLFRDDLVEALMEAGVDNLETCPAILRDPNKDNFALTNYRAVNIIGTIRCADLNRSEYEDITGTGLMAVGFRKLIIDEQKTLGALFFRLAESLSSIIVHEKVKAQIETKGFLYLRFRPLFD